MNSEATMDDMTLEVITIRFATRWRYWPLRTLAEGMGHEFHESIDELLKSDHPNPFRNPTFLETALAIAFVPLSIGALVVDAKLLERKHSRLTNKSEVDQ